MEAMQQIVCFNSLLTFTIVLDSLLTFIIVPDSLLTFTMVPYTCAHNYAL